MDLKQWLTSTLTKDDQIWTIFEHSKRLPYWLCQPELVAAQTSSKIFFVHPGKKDGAESLMTSQSWLPTENKLIREFDILENAHNCFVMCWDNYIVCKAKLLGWKLGRISSLALSKAKVCLPAPSKAHKFCLIYTETEVHRMRNGMWHISTILLLWCFY